MFKLKASIKKKFNGVKNLNSSQTQKKFITNKSNLKKFSSKTNNLIKLKNINSKNKLNIKNINSKKLNFSQHLVDNLEIWKTPHNVAASIEKKSHKHIWNIKNKTVGNSLLKEPSTELSLMDNGLRVASEKVSSDVVCLSLNIDAGSIFEKHNGVAHFAEHLFFKGTKNRSREDIEKGFENIGAEFNAYTSRNITTFSCSVHKDNLSKLMELFGDVMTNSLFTPESIENEKSVILTEKETVEKNWSETIFDHLHEFTFRDQPYATNIIGTVDSIKQTNEQHVKEYLDSVWRSNRMVLSAVGPVEHDEFFDLSSKYFSSLKPQEKYLEAPEPIFHNGVVNIRKDELPLVNVVYAFETNGFTDPDNIALQVMSHMLGDYNGEAAEYTAGKSMPLTKSFVSYDCGTEYSGFHTQYKKVGFYGVNAAVYPTRLEKYLRKVQKEVARFGYEVDNDRLEEAKNALKMGLLMSHYTLENRCDDIGKNLLYYGRRLHIAEHFARIDAITPNTIKDVALEKLVDQDFILAAVGNTFEISDYYQLRDRTYWATM